MLIQATIIEATVVENVMILHFLVMEKVLDYLNINVETKVVSSV